MENSTMTINQDEAIIKKFSKPVTLPPGTWMIDLTVGAEFKRTPTTTGKSSFVRIRLMDEEFPTDVSSSSFNVSKDALSPKFVSQGFPSSVKKVTIKGSLVINNTSNTSKNYYLFADIAAGDVLDSIIINSNWLETYINYYLIDYRVVN